MTALCSLYSGVMLATPHLSLWLESLFGEGNIAIMLTSDLIQFTKSLTLTIFSCSMVPMTTMSILACHRPTTHTGKTAAKYFAVLVLLAGNLSLPGSSPELQGSTFGYAFCFTITIIEQPETAYASLNDILASHF